MAGTIPAPGAVPGYSAGTAISKTSRGHDPRGTGPCSTTLSGYQCRTCDLQFLRTTDFGGWPEGD